MENLTNDNMKNDLLNNDDNFTDKVKGPIPTRPNIMSETINKVFKNEEHLKNLEQENPQNNPKIKGDKEKQSNKNISSSKDIINSSLNEDSSEEVNKKFEHYKKRIDENTRYNSLLLGNRSKAISLIKEYGENGDLSEDQVASLVNTLKSKDFKAEEEANTSEYNYVLPEFKSFHKLVTPDVEEQYKEFMNETDDQYNNKIKAYGAYLQEISREEKEEVIERLDELKNKPLMMLKEMMTIGSNYLKDGFGEVLEHGGVKQYLSYMQKQLTKSKKTIDELNAKLVKLKPNYDKPSYDLDELYEPLEEVKKENNNSSSSRGLMNTIVKEVTNKPAQRNFR